MNSVMLCIETHSLPEAGGLFDQDPIWVQRMKDVLAAKSFVEAELERKQGAGKHRP